MAKLPKSIIKKHGISKKAWRIFKSRKGRKKTRTKTRRKKTRTRTRRKLGKRGVKMAKSSPKWITKNDLFKGVGSGVSGIAEGIANQFLPMLPTNLGAGVVGLLLSRYTSGIAKQIGKGVVIRQVGELTEENIVPTISGSLKGMGSQGSGW